ncbi:GNAT family N-acetyltransferase [Sulfitobacter mediterraneus]|uniref:GNAT family N-acetyltransferase n=1 Tax=Sulfitobacter TaxID=60136 RepID=UPI0019315ACB|nr:MULTISPECIES: GNAT family N-acetyltransferase [Sulfitobacter]MBM1632874.1 GNAT family N-acetyltransferase [Sulfitobacter mediterraneus]MBM1640992.1 GNAT family N-acetyltransferase [Sulfitobacter mediterraneus]MBM1644739.1 GNAT family N-acetyltransferase [Sulfitobacter mediterraneus]MBM1649112.1 GNAT family N-acetyltransferase [Sulfitobacter mediterraneus]MBM1653133.1 GNAT family N-acetyltransferase [Sulfitobacter mediterraneus]
MTDRISIAPVPEQNRGVIDAMSEAYFRELLPEGPVYFPNALDRYWIEPGRHPYVIELNGAPVGFALVWNHKDGCHELTEFTIQPAFRNRGIGTEAATLIFQALGGDWVLGVAENAPNGMAFWRQCLESCDAVFEITEGPPRTANQCGSYAFRVGR